MIDTIPNLSNCDDEDDVIDDDDGVHYCYLRVEGLVGVENKPRSLYCLYFLTLM